MLEIENDKGETIKVFTEEEVAAQKAEVESAYKAQLEEKDKYVKDKLDQFVQGKKGIETKEEEYNAKLAEVDGIAKSALETAKQAEERRLNDLKKFIFQQHVGEDPELIAKVQEAYDLINLPGSTDDEIKARVAKAVQLAGISGASSKQFNPTIQGGYVPNFQKKEDSNYKQFKAAFGLEDIGQ